VKTGTVPATFIQVMSGQVDIGFSTPPVGLDAAEEGKIRIVALANDLATTPHPDGAGYDRECLRSC
jgi:ABC-type nitrate/sulfonate/bicarbonate transport system substrate-binding protein